MAKRKRTQTVASARKRREEREELAYAAYRKKRKKALKITGIVAAILAAAVVIGLLSLLIYDKSGAKMRNKTVAESENFKVNGTMMSYFIYDSYKSFVDYYGDYISQFGLDTTKTLKSQAGPGSDGTTWFDYFSDDAKSTVEDTLKLCEKAKSEGISLTDKELDVVNEMAKALKSSDYGTGVSTSDIRDCMKLLALATKYKNEAYGEISVTAEEITEYYNSHKNDYDKVSVLSYAFEYKEDGDYKLENARAAAEKLAAVKSENDFKVILGRLLTEKGTAEADITKALEAVASSETYTDTDTGKKLFAASAGDTFTVEDKTNHKVTVYYVVTAAAPDKSETIDVRNMLFNATSCGSLENAKAKAEKVYAEWQAGEATEESFAQLAMMYSADMGTAYRGGLYAGISKGETITEYDTWCFDEARKAGDSGVISSSYGYYVMYYIGEGKLSYESDVLRAIEDEKFTEQYKAFEEACKVDFDDDVIKDINA